MQNTRAERQVGYNLYPCCNARTARLEVERSTGRKVVTGVNAKGIRRLKARRDEDE